MNIAALRQWVIALISAVLPVTVNAFCGTDPSLAQNPFAFVLPWDDASAGVTNLQLNHTPAGKYGPVAAGMDGHYLLRRRPTYPLPGR